MDTDPEDDGLGSDLEVVVDGERTLHAQVSPQRDNLETPMTVIFESGLGNTRTVWGMVTPIVSQFATTVVYDRAGLGRSPVDPRPRTWQNLVHDLVCLVEQVGSGPVVLVGHSYGGPLVRLAQTQLPHLIKGMVLVDPSCEGVVAFESSLLEKATPWAFAGARLLARLGLYGSLLDLTGRYRLQGRLRRVSDRQEATESSLTTAERENQQFLHTLHYLEHNPVAAPQCPVTVLSARRRPPFAGGLQTENGAAHEKYVASLPQGRLVRAYHSWHMVHLYEPELVGSEICLLLASLPTTL